jgi:solute carrier family 35 protein C2
MSHRPLNVEENPLSNALPYGLSSDQDEGYPATLHNRGLRYASIVEKKRLWWRNAIINALFIASWCVTYLVSFDTI